MQHNEDKNFWHIRSANYDKLFWTKDKGFLESIIKTADLRKDQLALDVGTGTGVVANEVAKHVHHVVAIDIADSMLSKGNWSDISVLKWDIADALFVQGLFDRVFARMVFHHILDNLDRALLRCYDLLKENGKIVIAEGVPPTEDEEVVEWFTEMFKLKEKRRTFTPSNLVYFLEKNGFSDIHTEMHIMEDFNVNNWLENSGLSEEKQSKILQLHYDAQDRIKEVYNMRIDNDGQCLIRTVNVIITGTK